MVLQRDNPVGLADLFSQFSHGGLIRAVEVGFALVKPAPCLACSADLDCYALSDKILQHLSQVELVRWPLGGVPSEIHGIIHQDNPPPHPRGGQCFGQSQTIPRNVRTVVWLMIESDQSIHRNCYHSQILNKQASCKRTRSRRTTRTAQRGIAGFRGESREDLLCVLGIAFFTGVGSFTASFLQERSNVATFLALILENRHSPVSYSFWSKYFSCHQAK